MNIRKILLGICLLFPACMAQALSLGGTVVPKEKMIVYLLIGHSNMVGQDLAHSDGTTDPHVWNYQWNSAKQWVLAKEPPSMPKQGLSGHGCGGPGMPFLKGMAAAHPDYYFGVVSNASLSSTCRGENTGNNSSGLDPTDNRYWKDTYLYVQLLTAAREIQKDVTFGGILCMLGTVEATRTSETVCRAFSSDITQLATDLRADLGLPDLPFIMGEYEAGATGTFAPTLLMPSIIQSEIKLIPGKLTLSATVDSKGIAMLDDHHYQSNPQGQGEWAKRAVAVIQSKAWFPPPAASSVVRPLPASQAQPEAGKAALLSPGDVDLIWKDGSLYLITGGHAPAGLQSRVLQTKAVRTTWQGW